MRWARVAVVLFSLVCSAFSADSNEEPSLRIMARSSVYNVGEKKGIYCEGTNVPDQIEWLSPTNEVVEGRSTKNTRVYVERRNTEPHLVALIIHSTKLKDSGTWTCKAGELKQTIDIIVGEKVVMPEDLEELQADEGKLVRLNCEAKGNPLPVVQWYKETVIITDDSKYTTRKKGDTYTLEIKRLTHADAGEYMCKVTQRTLSHYTHKKFKLTVHHKPIPFNAETREIYTIAPGEKFRTEEVYAVYNETKKITCSALAYPPPLFKWHRRLKNNFDKEIISEEALIETSEDQMSSTLTLNMRDENDIGQYKCTAENSKGQITTIFDVTPGEKPPSPEIITLANANVTHLTFNVTCNNCTFQEDETAGLDPENLPVIGYSFELVPHQEDYPADWSLSTEFMVYIEDPDVTLFDVGPLANSTVYHVRVRSINAAGASDWLEMPDLPKTTDLAIRLAASLFLLVACFFLTM